MAAITKYLLKKSNAHDVSSVELALRKHGPRILAQSGTQRHSSRIAILCPLSNHASKYLLLLAIRTRHCRNPPHSANLSQTQFGSWRLLLRVRTRSAKM